MALLLQHSVVFLMMTLAEPRTYRSLVSRKRLESFRVVVRETDILVRADRRLEAETRESVLKHRMPLERYLEAHPDFVHTMRPWPADHMAPPIVRSMIEAGEKTGVGPMASVAGAIAECVGDDLLALSRNVIVENGGDIFIRTAFPVTAAIFAGKSALSGKVGVQIDATEHPIAVCTSSGTLGHSMSLGRADAAVVISDSAALADAAATAVGNQVRFRKDIEPAVSWGKEIEGVIGVVVVLKEKIGLWGDVNLVRMSDVR
jgi:ApbE superfamily uncharacterized protein (UPF0280 family)